jgi:outer membrane protein TolC
MTSWYQELSSRRSTTALAVLLGSLGAARPAAALQPLSVFIAGAKTASTDQRVAALTAEQQDADALTALGRNLPAASARFVYTHNQFESKIDPSQFAGGIMLPAAVTSKPLVIQPYNQLDAYFQLDVPLIDLAGWARTSAARANARAAANLAKSTTLDIEKQIAAKYYQLIGAEALGKAAGKTLAAAEQNLDFTQKRLADGVATPLDVDRAVAQVERARSSISDAELSAELARLALRTLSGIEPAGEAPAATDDLHEEAPLGSFDPGGSRPTPAVTAAVEQSRGAESAASAAKLALVPTVAASAQEHLTNASGFTGHDSVWVATLTASWRIDVTTFGTMKSQEAAAAIARTREQGARRRARDQVHESWLRVHNGIAKSRAARAEAEASDAAVERARERYREGAATELELIQAERDAFSATVSRIQADAELALARTSLRLDAGQPVSEETER